MRNFVLKNICNCDTTQQLRALEIRNKPAIRACMSDDHEIAVNEHLRFIEGLRTSDDRVLFLLLKDGTETVGAASLTGIDTGNQKCDWGFYLDESARGGVGHALGHAVINHAFESYGMQKINAEVVENNDRSVDMHKALGFLEEGFRTNNVVREGARIGMSLLGLSKADWMEKRDALRAAQGDKVTDIEISFDTSPSEALDFIGSIQSARARNNVNWMALLRLSVEKHPHLSKPIIAEIMKIDAEINGLTQKLVEDARKEE